MIRPIAFLLITLALLPACASISDLRDYQDRAEAALAEFRDGTITEEQYLAREADNRKQLTESTEDMVAAWAEKIQDGPITGQPLIDLMIGSLPAVLGGGYLLNQSRDRRRRRRGENVELPRSAPTSAP